MNCSFQDHVQAIDSLAVFGTLKRDPVISRLRDLLNSLPRGKSSSQLLRQYSGLLEALYPHGADLSAYIRQAVLSDDNFYVQSVAAGTPLDEEIREAARRELCLLQNLAALSCRNVIEAMDGADGLPVWTTSKLYLLSDFTQRLERLPLTGFGMFADYTFFRLADAGQAPASQYPLRAQPAASSLSLSGRSASSGSTSASAVLPSGARILPVKHPDVQPLDKLYRYERERDLIVRNTLALAEGDGATNMLLYGDAGTGKSSTIKAVTAAYADRGLRLIEIKKSQLFQIPEVLEALADNPLKFILFIDDLSFTSNDDNFSALKATLEGGVAGCTDRVVIYATSNRRHLVRETFADRAGDELHASDSIQETMSLADRFGLTITFSRPDKDDYLDIVFALAHAQGLDIPPEELARRAEAHAIRRGGRSPRAAKQLIQLLRIGL